MKKKHIKISVVIVTLNSEKTIEKAIQSVLMQDYDNYEIVIIDGASEDFTGEIIKKYDSKIAYWVSEKDDGIYDAMNKGLAKCTGDVVAFLGSDDYYLGGCFVLVNKLYQTKPDIDVLYCDVLWEDENGLKIRPNKEQQGNDADALRYYGNQFCHQGIFARKELFYKYGMFDTKYHILGDYDWLLRVYNAGCKYYIKDYPVVIFSRNGISSRQEKGAIQESGLIAMRAAQQFIASGKSGYKMSPLSIKNRSDIRLIHYLCDDISEKIIEKIKRNLIVLNKNECIIFGCGSNGRNYLKLLSKCGIRVKCFWDNQCPNKDILDIPVHLPNKEDISEDILILISSYWGYEQIETQLKEFGFLPGINYCSADFFLEEMYEDT